MTIYEEYADHFNVGIPFLYGVDDLRLTKVIKDHLIKGKPIVDDFHWWAGILDNAIT